MNFEKLTEDLNKATEERAAKELDRMIELHRVEVEKRKEEVKRYLANVGSMPGKAVDYVITNAITTEWERNDRIYNLLTDLKKELE